MATSSRRYGFDRLPTTFSEQNNEGVQKVIVTWTPSTYILKSFNRIWCKIIFGAHCTSCANSSIAPVDSRWWDVEKCDV
ncbi:MAG TPA: hypothetical protein VGE97_06795 [Nitrososphaera sp.]